MHRSALPSSEQPPWLFSRRADFWLSSGGASLGLLASLLVITWFGDWELSWVDFVLAEFHLGATYDAIIRRRLWRDRRGDILIAPLVILALTYALTMNSQLMLLTSITMYAAIWHRGRQSLGVARFYQRGVGGPVSRVHNFLFRGAIYLPMLAGMLAYTHLDPTDYEGKPYLALNFGERMTWLVALVAVTWVGAYLAWTLWRNRGARLASRLLKKGLECFDKLSMNGKYSFISSFAPFALRPSKGERWIFQQPASANHKTECMVHPGEWWVVLANAVAFGSGYAIGATNGSFVLGLAVYHEVQYLSFTYAMVRQPGRLYAAEASCKLGPALRTEVKRAASFLVWPVIGFTGAVAGGWADLEWLAPLGVGGLLCHYWFDSRIWTRRSRGTT